MHFLKCIWFKNGLATYYRLYPDKVSCRQNPRLGRFRRKQNPMPFLVGTNKRPSLIYWRSPWHFNLKSYFSDDDWCCLPQFLRANIFFLHRFSPDTLNRAYEYQVKACFVLILSVYSSFRFLLRNSAQYNYYHRTVRD